MDNGAAHRRQEGGRIRSKRITAAQQFGALAPWAGRPVGSVAVAWVDGAGDQRLFRFQQRPLPSARVRTHVRTRLTVLEAAGEQLADARMQDLQRQCDRGRSVGRRTGAIGIVARADPLLVGRRIVATLIDSGERMRALHQQLKQQNGQPEPIVFRSAIRCREREVLQFRRRVFRFFRPGSEM